MANPENRFSVSLHPHRRWNPLTGEWILVSPHRALRPWQGKVEHVHADPRPSYDPGCYLCPGNSRAGGDRNPAYASTFVFDNDFAALQPARKRGRVKRRGLLLAEPEAGVCRVACFSPQHNKTLAEMSTGEIRSVVDVWTEEYRLLGTRPQIGHVQIFENKGELMGCSNPHPHCQIWAQETIPVEPAKELRCLKRYRREHGNCLLCDYVQIERKEGIRMVWENTAFTAVVPFWAVWPFETMIVSRRHCGSLADLHEAEREQLAEVIREVTVRYDNIFETSFPYSSGVHQTPTDGKRYPECHLHMHFYPPLLRSATVKKFMVGYEMMANAQRDITPEASAERLRGLSGIHFTRSSNVSDKG
jgi:UDPglucose--hexose-1-phosphate uridylyltransferase